MGPAAPLPYRSPWMDDELEDLQRLAATFSREIFANIDRYSEQHQVDRDVWTKAGELGLLGLSDRKSVV